ncbi:hypothetical protein GGG16DRAFT_125667 [Schizophyllum commune]
MGGKKCAGSGNRYYTKTAGAGPSTLPPPRVFYEDQASNLNVEPATWVDCSGYEFTWTAGPIEENYPFQRQSPKSKAPLGFFLFQLYPPRARSHKCLKLVSSADGALPCMPCRGVALEIAVLQHQAAKPFGSVLRTCEHTYTQRLAKISYLQKQLNSAKLKASDATKDLKWARERVKRYREILEFAGQTLVPALHRILSVALKERWGPTKLLERLRSAANGQYHPRSYSAMDIHLGVLFYELGGAGLVHAANHSYLALPSLSTLQKYRRRLKITPSTDAVKLLEIVDNINVTYGPRQLTDCDPVDDAKDERCGLTAAWDEIANEEKIDYFPEKDHMGGNCLEHADCVETLEIGDDTKTVDAAVKAVRDGRLHIAPESTVATISRLSRKGYGARPVLIAPTCKKRTYQQAVRQTLYVLEAWRRAEHGEKKHGPIFNVASDGDAIRRAAFFVVCMSDEIKEGHPLYPNLRELFPLGLNPRIGKNGVSMDFDYKHLIKRLCTLLCSSDGMLVNDEAVNKNIILLLLERIPNRRWAETSVISLLEPDDAQDVTRAIKLLSLITDVHTINTTDLDPTQLSQYRALCVLGEMFHALLQPFINPFLTLTEQATSLVKFSHILCGLYSKNTRSFCSNQLYGDLQTMVKAAILYVEKARNLGGSTAKVYFCLLGTDILESLFGRSRMLGGHSPNASLGELVWRFQSAMNIDAIFEKHPELERPRRRLEMLQAKDMDHLRPPDWKPECVSVGTCNIVECWRVGVVAAEKTLRAHGVTMDESFEEIFARPATDLLRPFGKYVAISDGVDRSMAEASDDVPSEDQLINTSPSILRIDFDLVAATEQAERDARAAKPHSLQACIGDDRNTMVHKKSIVKIWFDMTRGEHKSFDRALRVRGFKTGGKGWAVELRSRGDDSTNTRLQFQLGNLFATLISPDGVTVALAIAKAAVIKRTTSSSSRCEDVVEAPLAEVCLEASSYTVTGQVLSMRPIAAGGTLWAWDGDMVRLMGKRQSKASTDGTAPSQSRELMFSVPGGLLRALQCQRLESYDVPDGALGPAFDRDTTWAILYSQLYDAWSGLKRSAGRSQTLQSSIPVFHKTTGLFPYVLQPCETYIHGVTWSSLATAAGIALNSDKRTCLVCGKAGIKQGDLQQHVGAHLLKTRAGMRDESAKRQVAMSMPCGFCGGDGCTVAIKGGGTGIVHSTCPQVYNFKISTTRDYSIKRPCTNVPVVCPLRCGEIHWKYNFQEHFERRHPTWASINGTDFDTFKARIQVSAAEQLGLGVLPSNVRVWPPLAHTPFVPPSDKENIAPLRA